VLRGTVPSADAAREIFRFVRERLPAYKRVRRLEFAELPKTISGKIRRVELRVLEERRFAAGIAERAPAEFWEEDFPQLREGYTTTRHEIETVLEPNEHRTGGSHPSADSGAASSPP
jgi:acetyl-CoA synthetase